MKLGEENVRAEGALKGWHNDDRACFCAELSIALIACSFADFVARLVFKFSGETTLEWISALVICCVAVITVAGQARVATHRDCRGLLYIALGAVFGTSIGLLLTAAAPATFESIAFACTPCGARCANSWSDMLMEESLEDAEFDAWFEINLDNS